jgi:antitoxin PrlF
VRRASAAPIRPSFIGALQGSLKACIHGQDPYCKEIPCERAVITSKLTSKAQTTIPQPVRAALHLREGDELAYVIEDGRVIVTKAQAEPTDDPFGAFSEWDSDADRRAYAKL